MRKLFTVGAVVLWSSVAFAQAGGGDAAKKAPPASEAKPAAPPPADSGAMMGAPKPAEELQQLKDMVGVWKCEGKTVVGGKEMQDKSTATFMWDLDKFFVSSRMESPKSKDNPSGYKGRAMYGWDPGAKQFVAMGVDNMGGMSMLTSKGWSGDKMEWAGKAKMMGQEMDAKETITKKGPREVMISGSAGPVTWESNCKK
jgi:hypothetical protein